MKFPQEEVSRGQAAHAADLEDLQDEDLEGAGDRDAPVATTTEAELRKRPKKPSPEEGCKAQPHAHTVCRVVRELRSRQSKAEPTQKVGRE